MLSVHRKQNMIHPSKLLFFVEMAGRSQLELISQNLLGNLVKVRWRDKPGFIKGSSRDLSSRSSERGPCIFLEIMGL